MAVLEVTEWMTHLGKHYRVEKQKKKGHKQERIYHLSKQGGIDISQL